MPVPDHQLEKPIQRQYGLLTAQFLLGMAVNLIGVPGELNPGLAKTSSSILLLLHVLIALALIANAIYIWRLTSRRSAPVHRLAHYGMAAIGAAILGGILTLTAPLGNLWSYLMAVAFIAAFGIYGRLSVQDRTNPARESH